MNFADRFAAAFSGRQLPGLSLTGVPIMAAQSPITGPIPLPQPRPMGAEVPTVVYNSPGGPATDPSAPPFRLDRGLPPPPDLPAVASPSTASPPVVRPQSFPVEGTAPVPYASRSGTGLTLNSNPTAGWSGTAGLSPTPGSEGTAEAPKGLADLVGDKGAMEGLGEIAKGLKPKVADPTANQIIPPNLQPNVGAASAADLMTAMLNSKRQRTGLSLYGSR